MKRLPISDLKIVDVIRYYLNTKSNWDDINRFFIVV